MLRVSISLLLLLIPNRTLCLITNSNFPAFPTGSPAFGGKGASIGGFGGTVDIIQLNADGKPIDHWKLHGPIIKSISFGDLSYESDDLVEYKIDIEYDFATYAKGEPK